MSCFTLRERRKERGWTQEQLAVLSGVDQTTISRLETEPEPNPTEDTKERLAKALGIAPSDIQFTAPKPEQSVSKAKDRAGHSKTQSDKPTAAAGAR